MMKNKKLIVGLLAFALILSSIALITPASAQPRPTVEPYIYGPYIDRVVILNILETTTVWEAFKRGELSVAGQYMGTIPQEDFLKAAEEDPGILPLLLGRSTFEGYLGFNVRRWPTSELEVRRAIAHLIDYDYATTMIWKPGAVGPTWGYCPPLFREWISPNVDIRARYPYSLELAKKELTDAGWTYENGKWISPNGTEMGTLIYLCPGYSPERIELGLKLKEDAAKIGIQWEVVHPPDWPSTERKAYIERDFHLFANYATANALNPARWYYAAFHSSSWRPPGTSTINHFGIMDPDLDELIDKLRVTNDLEEAKSLVHRIQEIVEDKCYVMPLVHIPAIPTAIRQDQFRNFFGIKTMPEVSTEDPYSVWGGYFYLLNIKPIDKEFGGTYIENRAYWPSSYNPLNWMEAPEYQTYKFIYLSLAYRFIDPDGRDVTVPLLARDWKVETWEVAPGKLGNKYTFYLFDNVSWHDGVPFTAEDVKFTFDFVTAVKTACALYAPIIPIYVKSEVVDKYTVEIYTSETGLFQFYNVIGAPILPKHIWEPLPDPFAFENLPPIGTGPFIWEDYKPHEYISLRANPRYHFSTRRLHLSIPLKEEEKVAGEMAKFQFKLTGPEGETVTNGTVRLSLIKAGEEVLTTTADHIGGGTYEATIDTGAIGTGDYIIKAMAEYTTPLFTYKRSAKLSLTVLPEVYRKLIESSEALRGEVASVSKSVSALEASISELRDTVSGLAGLAGLSGMVTASIGLSVISIIIAIVAVVLSLRKKST